MFDFKQSAKATVSNSILQIDREKLQWSKVDGKPVTIIAVDRNEGPMVDTKGNLVTDDDGVLQMTMYTTVLVEEYPKNFLGGFNALDRMVEKWLENFDDIEDLNRELKKYGGVKIRTSMDGAGNARKITVLD